MVMNSDSFSYMKSTKYTCNNFWSIIVRK